MVNNRKWNLYYFIIATENGMGQIYLKPNVSNVSSLSYLLMSLAGGTQGFHIQKTQALQQLVFALEELIVKAREAKWSALFYQT